MLKLIQRMERQASNWEKRMVAYYTDKGLITLRIKDIYKSMSKILGEKCAILYGDRW